MINLFTAQFDQQEASDTIMRLTSERNSVMGGLAKQQSRLEQFRKYANIKEHTRSTVVNLIDYIHIRENKNIDVRLMYCDRFASMACLSLLITGGSLGTAAPTGLRRLLHGQTDALFSLVH